MKCGDVIGGIYERGTGKDKQWFLAEGKITKIVEGPRGTKVYSKRFYPIDKDEIECNTEMITGDSKLVLIKDVCLLTDEIREKFVSFIEYANAHPDEALCAWAHQDD